MTDLFNFLSEDTKLKLHEEKQKRVDSLKNKYILLGKTQEESLALAEQEVFKPEQYSINMKSVGQDLDFKEIKMHLMNADFELLKKYVSVRESCGLNIKADFITSVLDLLEKGHLKIKGNEVVLNEDE